MTVEFWPGPQLSQGPKVDQFEAALAEYLHVSPSSVVACSSGTAALHLAFSLLPKTVRTVIVPATTFIASANAVRYCGLDVEVADVRPDTWTIQLPRVDTPILTVDLFGVSALQEGGGWLIEDAAQALGTKNVPYASLACFSFFANKIITTGGEGGAVITQNPYEANILRLLRQQGKDRQTKEHVMLGYNYRMTEWQAEYGLRELKDLHRRVVRKREINIQYQKELLDFTFQKDSNDGSNCWLTSLVLENRDEVMDRLFAEGIESRLVYKPIHAYDWVTRRSHPATPVADWLGKHGLSLPSHHMLKPDEQARVIEVIRKHGKPTQYD